MIEYRVKTFYKKVPLDYSKPDGEKITIFYREIARKENDMAPLMVYFEGGPGFPPPRSVESSDWLPIALERFRIVLIDQRGTGNSCPIGKETVERFSNGQELANYLTLFRADNIIRDAESVRRDTYKGELWICAGQSYGGFLTCTYLSFAPRGLKGAVITGGLPPLKRSIQEVYKSLLNRVYDRNREFYGRYPENVAKVKKIISLLTEQPMVLSGKDVFTAERFLDAGLVLGRTDGLRKLHELLENPFTDSSETNLRWAFAMGMVERSYETNPIYAFLHESIYCNGSTSSAWAFDQCLQEDTRFQASRFRDNDFVSFRGEGIRKNMFMEYEGLAPFKEAADILAKENQWSNLYNMHQLENNMIPTCAFVYKTDIFVDYDYSKECANSIQNCVVVEHDRWQHDSIHTHSQEVLSMLYETLQSENHFIYNVNQ